MSLITRNGVLKVASPLFVIKRFRGKINIQRPRTPHFVKAKYIEFTKPIYPKKQIDFMSICNIKKEKLKENLENPLQRIIACELRDRISASKLIGFFHLNPITAESRTKAEILFKKNDMFINQYGKMTMEMAVAATPYNTILQFFCSHNMLAFSKDGNIKKMLTIAKKFPQFIFLAGIYEGKLLNKDEILYYQQIPSIEMAQVQLVQTLNSIGNQIVLQLNSHPSNLVSQLQERAKRLEDKKE